MSGPSSPPGRTTESLDAVFNVYKPPGPTSHDVVARVRRAGRLRRVGHAGTLDPLAEGVLVVAAGRATRVVEYLADLDKAYLARVAMGVETTTYDAEGRVVADRPIGDVGPARIEQALGRLRGRIEQVPPAYSAISIGGQRLYDLARKGQTVDVPARSVEITTLELRDWQPPVATVFVECSKGTYIRSLAHDLGAALGCGAHLAGLVRTRVGPFHVAAATPLDALEARLRDGSWREVALAPDQAIPHLPPVTFPAAATARIGNGVAVPASETPGSGVEGGGTADAPAPGAPGAPGAPEAPQEAPGAPGPEGLPGGATLPVGTLARAYDEEGRFLAIVRLAENDAVRVWRPEKVFSPCA